MSDELTLYTNPMSRGRIARWMLEEVGVPYQVSYLSYDDGSLTAPEYRAINPMGKVPSLVHGSHVVTECAAICAYLADAFPDAGLAPPPDQRSSYYRWFFFAAGPMEAAVVNRALGVEVPPERQGMAGYGTFQRAQDTLAAALSNEAYIAGPEFTAADVYIGAQVSWGLNFGTVDPLPAFKSYAERVTAREAHERAKALDDAAMQEASSDA